MTLTMTIIGVMYIVPDLELETTITITSGNEHSQKHRFFGESIDSFNNEMMQRYKSSGSLINFVNYLME